MELAAYDLSGSTVMLRGLFLATKVANAPTALGPTPTSLLLSIECKIVQVAKQIKTGIAAYQSLSPTATNAQYPDAFGWSSAQFSLTTIFGRGGKRLPIRNAGMLHDIFPSSTSLSRCVRESVC